jgi:hypothetical protein
LPLASFFDCSIINPEKQELNMGNETRANEPRDTETTVHGPSGQVTGDFVPSTLQQARGGRGWIHPFTRLRGGLQLNDAEREFLAKGLERLFHKNHAA